MSARPLTHFKSKNLSGGFSLVELMVAMTITLIVMSGVIQTMLDNRGKFLLGAQLSIIQENARFAVEELSRELRMAGYQGCSGGAQVANTLNASTGNIFYDGFGIEGWDSSQGRASFPDEFNGSLWSFNDDNKTDPDAFIVKRANADDSFSVVSHNVAGAMINVGVNHEMRAGDIVVAATPDCSQVVMFQATRAAAQQIAHGNVGAVIPGNCTKQKLYGAYNCSDTTNASGGNLPRGSKLMNYKVGAYYIGPSGIDASIPSLYRESIQNNAGTSSTIATELLIGIENMQLLYGVDSSGDKQTNRYVSAEAITELAELQWANVVSMRISLLLRSLDRVWAQDQTFVFNGQNYSDRFIRQRLTTTVVLRN